MSDCPYKGKKEDVPSFIRLYSAKENVRHKKCETEKNEVLCRHYSNLEGDISYKGKIQIQNTTNYIRRVNHLTIPEQKIHFDEYLQELNKNNYKIKKENDKIIIFTPYCDKILEHFYSPVFVDATFSSDKYTIIHADCIATNKKLSS